MKLVDYIREERGNATALAAALRVSLSYLSQMASTGVISPVRAVAVERATRGKVRRWDLRPSDWHLIWPELIGMEGAPALEGEQPAVAPAPGGCAGGAFAPVTAGQSQSGVLMRRSVTA